MKCPRTRDELREVAASGYHVWICPHCHGILIQQSDLLHKAALLDIATPQTDAQSVDQRNGSAISPHTGKAMRSEKFKGVTLDYCDASKSVWLDKGELEKIVAQMRKYRGRDVLPPSDSVDWWDAFDTLEFVGEIGSATVEVIGGVVEGVFGFFDGL